MSSPMMREDRSEFPLTAAGANQLGVAPMIRSLRIAEITGSLRTAIAKTAAASADLTVS